MALIVGIKNGTDKGFTEEEIEFTNGFSMGVLAMACGIGRIGGEESKYSVHITAEEVVERFKIACAVYDDRDSWPDYLTDINFVKRLEVAEWYCNVTNESQEQFMHKMRNTLFDNVMRRLKLEHVRMPNAIHWYELQKQRDTIDQLVGMAMTGAHHDANFGEWMSEQLIDVFEIWDRTEPIYNYLYLRWNKDTGRYWLSEQSEEEE